MAGSDLAKGLTKGLNN